MSSQPAPDPRTARRYRPLILALFVAAPLLVAPAANARDTPPAPAAPATSGPAKDAEPPGSLSPQAPAKLAKVRSDRKAAERDLTRLRTTQRGALSVGLPAGDRIERDLADSLERYVRTLRAEELRLSGPPKAPKPPKKTTQKKTTQKKAAPKARTASKPAEKRVTGNPQRDKIVDFVKAQLGKPYRWGGAGPDSFDCSGLAMRAWQKAGVRLPHYTVSQWNQGRRIGRAQLQPGDLIFRSGLQHVMIYVGDGKVIHAPRTGSRIQYAPVPGNADGFVTFSPTAKKKAKKSSVKASKKAAQTKVTSKATTKPYKKAHVLPKKTHTPLKKAIDKKAIEKASIKELHPKIDCLPRWGERARHQNVCHGPCPDRICLRPDRHHPSKACPPKPCPPCDKGPIPLGAGPMIQDQQAGLQHKSEPAPSLRRAADRDSSASTTAYVSRSWGYS